MIPGPLDVDVDACASRSDTANSKLAESLESAKRVIELLAKTKTKLSAIETITNGEGNSKTPLNGTVHQESIESQTIPSTIGRFEIQSLAGQGGFGLVFLGRDPKLDRSVAIKVPQLNSLLNDEAQKRFAQEGRTLATLNHPNIVPVYEVGHDGPVSYIASEYVAGLNLAEHVEKHGALTGREAATIVLHLASGVQHAHSRGVIHRDLKPANVLPEQ